MSAAVTAETTAGELAAELRALAARIEQAKTWSSLRESLDAVTPTLKPLRSRVVRHTRTPKAPAELPAPAKPAEPAKVTEPAPAKAEPKPAAKAPDAKRPPEDRGPSSRRREPHGGMSPSVPVRCPGTLRVVVFGLLLSLWWTAGEASRTARRHLRWRWRETSRPVRWALSDIASVARGTRSRIAARITSKLRRRS